MPIPIMPNNTDSFRNKRNQPEVPVDYGTLDMSVLENLRQKGDRSSDLFKVSDFEAGMLFRLWKGSETDCRSGTIKVPDTFSNNDVLRLKACGLVSGGVEEVALTDRGRGVIKTMVLGEDNNFDNDAVEKPFQQILAESKPKGSIRLALGKKK